MAALPSRRPLATHPEMVWVEGERFMGWACSECAWQFNPSAIPAGNTLGEIRQNYGRQRERNLGRLFVTSIQRNPNFIGMACCLASASWLRFLPITIASAALKSRAAIRAAQCKYREGETLLVPPFLGSTDPGKKQCSSVWCRFFH